MNQDHTKMPDFQEHLLFPMPSLAPPTSEVSSTLSPLTPFSFLNQPPPDPLAMLQIFHQQQQFQQMLWQQQMMAHLISQPLQQPSLIDTFGPGNPFNLFPHRLSSLPEPAFEAPALEPVINHTIHIIQVFALSYSFIFTLVANVPIVGAVCHTVELKGRKKLHCSSDY
jgi:hypothetical protein